MDFKRISATEALVMMGGEEALHGQLDAADSAVQVVDIRDEESYKAGHIPGAFHLHNSNIQEFMEEADPEQPVIVCCYHGHMSQSAAAYLSEQGFHQTYSLDGGFEGWAALLGR